MINSLEIPAAEQQELRVLHADDSGVARLKIGMALAAAKINSTQVNSGEAAVLALQEAHVKGKPFNALVLDWNMPGISGHGVLKWLVQDKRFDHLCVVVFSDNPDAVTYEYICQRVNFHIQHKEGVEALPRRLQHFVNMYSHQQASAGDRPGTTGSTSQWSSQGRILVLDGSKAVAKMYGDLLRSQGYTAWNTSAPAEALALAQKHRPHVVIVAAELEVGTGTLFISKFVEDIELRGVSCVLTTAGDRDAVLLDAFAAGAIDVFHKDDPMHVFLPRIAAVCRPLIVAENALKTAQEKNSELERALKDLEEKQDQLVQASKLAALGELGAGIVHELNQPLTAIHGLAGLMLDKANHLPAPVPENLKIIEEEAARMAGIVSNIRSFSRKTVRKHLAFKIAAPIEKAVTLLTAAAREADIQIGRREWDASLCISGDAITLQQVFVNLIANARDALCEQPKTQARKIMLTLKADAQNVVVRVEDNGPGVPQKIRDEVFQAFFTTKGVDKGTGLGLSITSAIVQDHQGTIEVTDSYLGGAGFELRFPKVAEVTEILPTPTASGAAVAADSSGSTKKALSNLRVLVVDDEPLVRQIIAAIVSTAGGMAQEAGSGFEALDILAKERFDVIFTDYMMPKMSGIELIEALRAKDNDTPVVLVTGEAGLLNKEQSAELGALTCLEKPLNRDKLHWVAQQIAARNNTLS